MSFTSPTADDHRLQPADRPTKTIAFVTECPPALFEIWNLEEQGAPFDSPAELIKAKDLLTRGAGHQYSAGGKED
jgi:hypothetical protein